MSSASLRSSQQQEALRGEEMRAPDDVAALLRLRVCSGVEEGPP
jgi:hypothetical protein